ncbi:hypothetical protein, partial [Photobacterium sp. GB-72]|uniref:hypothetical protein n=1 Tax=Photobacterium sp. GB-72 TaxID=2022105 RepID=UPI000D423AC4
KQGGRLVLDQSGNLYDSGVALSQRYGSLNGGNTFTGNNRINTGVVQGSATAVNTGAGRVSINGRDVAFSLTDIENAIASNDRDLSNIEGMKVARLNDVSSLNANVGELERKARDLGNRTGSVEGHVNRAKKTADDALTSTIASRTAAINNGNKIDASLKRVASLEQFERDCRAQKNGLCKPNKPPKPLQWKCPTGYTASGSQCYKQVTAMRSWGSGSGVDDCRGGHAQDQLRWDGKMLLKGYDVFNSNNGHFRNWFRIGDAEYKRGAQTSNVAAWCEFYSIYKRYNSWVDKISYCPSGYYKSGNECKAY